MGRQKRGEERRRGRRCKCGVLFRPFAPKQLHCLYCILEAKPTKPNDVDERRNTREFDEWFIYRWHEMRKAAAKARGVNFVFDDGVLEMAEVKE